MPAVLQMPEQVRESAVCAGLLDLSRQSDWSDPEQVQESAVAEETPRSAFSSLGVRAGRRGACLETVAQIRRRESRMGCALQLSAKGN